MTKTPTPEALQAEALAFRDDFETVLLATADGNAIPDASYAPCVIDDDGRIAVFISELASHTRNLRVNPRASLMFIADESASRNLFARRRLILSVSAETLPRNHAQWPILMEKMRARHGKTIDLLMQLPDFQLFRFTTLEGTWVRGFGQAFPVLNDRLEISAERRTKG